MQEMPHSAASSEDGVPATARETAGAAAAPAAAAAAAAAAGAVPGRRLRQSCDFCTKRKRKCDGDGVNRCSFCIAKNQPECHYSARRLTGPRPDSVSRRAFKKLPGKAAKATAATGGGDSGGNGELVSDHRRCSRKLPLKRARLSPSPATGLIGLKENVYIAEFFRTMGFLPFTTESFIRKAMVKTMFRAVQRRDPGFHGCLAAPSAKNGEKEEEEEEEEEQDEEVVEEEEEEGGWGNDADALKAGPGDAIDSAGGACVLWSTVAVGCLVGGRPKSSVEGYARLAREALSGCFDDGSIQTARAFTAMALLHNFMGSEEKFSKYIDFARSIMRALPAKEIPQDLTDAHMFVKACDLFDGFYHQLGEEDLRDAMGAVSGDTVAVSLAKKPRPIPQSELCRWLLKTDIRLSACFSMDMQNNGFFGDLSKAAASSQTPSPRPAEFDPAPGSGSASGSKADGRAALLSTKPPHGGHDERPGAGPGTEAGLDTPAPRICWLRQLSGTVAEPPPPGPITRKFAARVLPDVKLMMHLIQSPEVRGGVGELYFRMITAYVCLLQGQPENAVHGLLRCADIFVKTPGICRFTSWEHLAHCCLAGIAASGLPEKYEELRSSYNSVIDKDDRRAPPFEEFRGMGSICGNVLCKSVYSFFIAVTALGAEPSTLGHDAPIIPSEDEAKLPLPKTASQDVDGACLDQSWARGAFDERRRQPAAMEEGGKSSKTHSRGVAAAAPIAAPAAWPPAELGAGFEFVGAFGGSAGKEQGHPRAMGVRFGFGHGVGSAGSTTSSGFGSGIGSGVGSSIGSSISSRGSISNAGINSTRPISAGDVSASTAATSAVVGQDGNRCPGQQDHHAGDGEALLPLLSSGSSAQTKTLNARTGPAEVGASGGCDVGRELLHASELEGEEIGGLLDAVDELLGNGDLDGFGEGGGEEDLFPFVDRSA